MRALAPGVWWIPALAAGTHATSPAGGKVPVGLEAPEPAPAATDLDTTSANGGVISNLLLVADGPRTWLVGSGPDRTWAARLACVIRRDTGRRVTDVIAPWPRPELVLGARAFPQARYWAHEWVAQRMAQRCPHCTTRLDERLGRPARSAAAVARSIRIPNHTVRGEVGRLGPFQWQLLWRTAPTTAPAPPDAASTPVTVWTLSVPSQMTDKSAGTAPGIVLGTAHGLLWGWGAPDARDAVIADLHAATQTLVQRTDVQGWLPEQGPWLSPAAVALHERYWAVLADTITVAQTAGALETQVVTDLSTLPPAFGLSPRHALNWQRAWRELELR